MSTTTAKDPRDGMEPIPDWSEDGTVYVDGRLTRNQARHRVCHETGGWYKYSTARRVWMHILEGDESLRQSQGEFDSCWWVCEKDQAGALAMWAVTAP